MIVFLVLPDDPLPLVLLLQMIVEVPAGFDEYERRSPHMHYKRNA